MADAVLKRETERIFRDVMEIHTQEKIDQMNRWVAMALASASDKTTLKDAKVFLMTLVRDCPTEMVEMAREMPTFEAIMPPSNVQ